MNYPSSYPDLLPPNATAKEKAVAGTSGRLMDIPVPIRDLWRWDTCPEEHLPWLAWAMSVDLWDHKWPTEKKRNLIRESFELHAHKGTLYTIEKYLEYADAPLKRAIVPPDKPFPGRAMTVQERADWLNRFPQVRIFQYRDRGEATFGAFATGCFHLAKTFLGAGPAGENSPATKATFFPYQTSAPERWGRRAFLWDKGPHFKATGLETPLRWLERTRVEESKTVYDGEQVLIPGSNVQSLFCGAMVKGNLNRRNGRMFPVASTANTRVVTVYLDRQQTTDQDVRVINTTRPSLEPINAFPEYVAERANINVRHSMFCGMPGRWLDPETKQRKLIKSYLGGFLPETTSPLRLYDRLYLHDRERLPDGRPPAIYAGHFRLGMPPYHAELTVDVKGKRPTKQFGRFVYGHLLASDMAPLKLARTAIVRAKSFRDKVGINTAIHRVIRASDGVRSGAGHRSGGLIASY